MCLSLPIFLNYLSKTIQIRYISMISTLLVYVITAIKDILQLFFLSLFTNQVQSHQFLKMLLVVFYFSTTIFIIILEIYLLHPPTGLPEIRYCVGLFRCLLFQCERVIFISIVILTLFLGTVSSVLKRVMLFSGQFGSLFR
jgi:hypothetical protein